VRVAGGGALVASTAAATSAANKAQASMRNTRLKRRGEALAEACGA